MNWSSPISSLLLGLAASAAFGASSPSRNLAVFNAHFPVSLVRTQDCVVRLAKRDGAWRLRVETGARERWPGVTLPAPESPWDLSGHDSVTAELHNPGPVDLKIFCRVDNAGANGTDFCVTGEVTVPSGGTRTMRVRLPHHQESRLGGRLFGLRGYPVEAPGPKAFQPDRVNQVLFFLHQPASPHVFEIGLLRAEGTYTPPTAWIRDADPFFPLIDPLGQYRHKIWPGKVSSPEVLPSQAAAEADTVSAPGPAGWNRYGGWADGPLQRATGFFRTERLQGRWWLIDPEGRLFFSHGIDCVRMLDTTPIEDREAWFEGAPWSQPEFAEFLTRGYALKGHYAGRTVPCFSFAGANLKRKYGADWRRVAAERIHGRLRQWGLNTIGMWSDEGVRLLRRTPYVDAIGSRGARLIEGSEGYWGKFPDVFDPSFAAGLRRDMAARQGKSAGDAWCLGYFADNELSWGDEVSLAVAAVQSPADQPAKRAFLDYLKTAHGSEVTSLNAVWGTDHASWDAWLESRTLPQADRARADLQGFYTVVAETYFRTVRDAIKAVAPQQLYLGCRFAWSNARAAAAAARYCDVVSYNLYQRSVAEFVFPGSADVPLLIGEFHFGALDRGLFHTGLVPVSNQDERAAAYAAYVKGALQHPQFVGCHWFQYQDEPTTGRVYDEENYQIGFVSIADVPYAETVAATRQVADQLYRLRLRPSTP